MSLTPAQRRARQTVTNLSIALGACLALVAIIFIAAPQSSKNLLPKVDYQAVASQAKASSGNDVLAPTLPVGWWSNKATYDSKPSDGTTGVWTVGFVAKNYDYVGITQTFGTNPNWFVLQMQTHKFADSTTIDGKYWSYWKSKEVHDPVQMRDQIWVFQHATGTVMLYGTATQSEFLYFQHQINQLLK